MEQKNCGGCEETFERSNKCFNTDPTTKDGFDRLCRICSTKKYREIRRKRKERKLQRIYEDAVSKGHMVEGERINWVSVSGGKDSTALILWTLRTKMKNCRYIYADTGHEHASVSKYLDYLEITLNIKIHRVKSIGFLDLCIKKKRFPSVKARFCTEHLKLIPLARFMWENEFCDHNNYHNVFVGIRKEESRARSNMLETMESNIKYPPRRTSYQKRHHPLLEWAWQDVFQIHRDFGIEPNPLYKEGMHRVGCFPCILARKAELRFLFSRFPETIDKLRTWEELVGEASSRGSASFFPYTSLPKDTTGGIDVFIKYLDNGEELPGIGPDTTGCFSVYGLCE